MQGLGENRQPRGDAGDLKLVGDALDDALVSARRGRGLEAPVGRVFQALLRAEDADQFLGLVVVGRQVVIRDGPVEALAVAAVGLEIVRAHAQGDAAVVIGAAADHARAPPHEFVAGGGGVRFAGDLPAAHQGGVVEAERLGLGAGGAVRSVVVPLEHVALLGRIVVAARLQHADLGAGEREHVGRDAASGPRPHYDHVIGFRTGFDLRHRASLSENLKPFYRRHREGGYCDAPRAPMTSLILLDLPSEPRPSGSGF